MAKVEHRRPRSRTGLAPRWPAILTPFAVFFIAGLAPLFGVTWEKLIGGILAIGLILIISRRPTNCFLALVVLLPWHVLGLATLYRIGVPAAIVRVAASWKEAILFGLLVATIRQRKADKKPFDRLDKLIFGFLALNFVYLLLPRLVVLGDAPMGWSNRLLGFRSNVFFFVLLFVARHVPFDANLRKRLVPAMLISGASTAVFGIYNWVASNSWNDFVVNTIQVPKYLIQVIGTGPPDPGDLRRYTDGGAVRVSSSLLEPVMFGIFLVIPFGIGLAMLARRRSGAGAALAVVSITAAMVLTQTRAALLGAFVVALLVLRSPGGHRLARAKLGLLLAAGVVFAIPAGLAVGVVQRSLDAFGGNDESSAGIHGDDFERGLEGLVEHPLGLGLGTGGGVGLRFEVKSTIISENAYFQVGNEIGIIAMVLFIAIYVSVIKRLRQRARDPSNPDSHLCATFAAIGCGFLAMGLLQQVWAEYAVVAAFWGPAGLLLSVLARDEQSEYGYGGGYGSGYGGGGTSSNSYPYP